jgi:hypothetical protein
LHRLRSPDGDVREGAADELDALGREGLSAHEALEALESAAGRFPARRFDIQDTAADLILAVGYHPDVAYVPVIEKLYRRLNVKARLAALELLARTPEREAADAIMALIRANARPGRLRALPVHVMIERPHHPDALFPELFQFLEVRDLTWPICELCLGWIDNGGLAGADIAHDVANLLRAYAPRRDRLLGLYETLGKSWAWDDGYALLRRETSLLLDLLGHVPTPAVQTELRRALGFEDVRLKYFAIVSLLRLGRTISGPEVLEVAESPEMRNWLWEELVRQGRSSIFPHRYRSQAAFAEGDLVRWLAFPHELGRVPDELELAKVVTIEPGYQDYVLDYYVFRFRLGEPHWAAKEGWLAGVSGPFLRGEATTQPLADAFSRFESWSRRTAEGHVGDLDQLAADWRDRWTKRFAGPE